MSLRRESPGPDRLAVRRCSPDCRNAGYRLGRTVTPRNLRRPQLGDPDIVV